LREIAVTHRAQRRAVRAVSLRGPHLFDHRLPDSLLLRLRDHESIAGRIREGARDLGKSVLEATVLARTPEVQRLGLTAQDLDPAEVLAEQPEGARHRRIVGRLRVYVSEKVAAQNPIKPPLEIVRHTKERVSVPVDDLSRIVLVLERRDERGTNRRDCRDESRQGGSRHVSSLRRATGSTSVPP